jgi:hypothetical protein
MYKKCLILFGQAFFIFDNEIIKLHFPFHDQFLSGLPALHAD